MRSRNGWPFRWIAASMRLISAISTPSPRITGPPVNAARLRQQIILPRGTDLRFLVRKRRTNALQWIGTHACGLEEEIVQKVSPPGAIRANEERRLEYPSLGRDPAAHGEGARGAAVADSRLQHAYRGVQRA